ncbi:hypothetical protein M427DRAFT_58996 [Gonapodya prolifera JEL478]|uniref:Uncharacterized protein n=1 Tax=Gonapodya prolifera (strain JEL478) TaxID=1344416 RepID=A0A139A8P0_GONPJ|nr:hypothetical protein M427DRAFT_58996 [Gonapodya prolifera JEL478]|eukprot:KXS13097.1 hypothetical protein M427DRAFT_58996 [Gonapodya prolifera JEL478]
MDVDQLAAELYRVALDPRGNLFRGVWPVRDDGDIDPNFVVSAGVAGAVATTTLLALRLFYTAYTTRLASRTRRAALAARLRAVKRARDGLIDEIARLEYACTKVPGGVFDEIERIGHEVEGVLGPDLGEDEAQPQHTTSIDTAAAPSTTTLTNGHAPHEPNGHTPDAASFTSSASTARPAPEIPRPRPSSRFIPTSSSSSTSISSLGSSADQTDAGDATPRGRAPSPVQRTSPGRASKATLANGGAAVDESENPSGAGAGAASATNGLSPATVLFDYPPRPTPPLAVLTPLHRRLLHLDDRLIRLLESLDAYSPSHVARLLRSSGGLPPSAPSDSEGPPVRRTSSPSPGRSRRWEAMEADPESAVGGAVRSGCERVRRRRREVAREVAGRCKGVDRAMERVGRLVKAAEREAEEAKKRAEEEKAAAAAKENGGAEDKAESPGGNSALDPVTPTASGEPGADVLARLEKAFVEGAVGGP